MICGCRLIACNKCTPLGAAVLTVGKAVCVTGRVWELFLSNQFGCELKTTLKKKKNYRKKDV